jgi:hypothetical protein
VYIGTTRIPYEEQVTGPYLMLFQHQWQLGKETMPRELRCLVRTVTLKSLGNFMMGLLTLKLPGESEPITISLSGMFGSDGLPLSVPTPSDTGNLPSRLWALLHPLPEELSEHYWRDESDHSGNGKAAQAIAAWAKERETRLRRFRKDNTPVGVLSMADHL